MLQNCTAERADDVPGVGVGFMFQVERNIFFAVFAPDGMGIGKQTGHQDEDGQESCGSSFGGHGIASGM